MPINKHALIRYKTIDNCLQNRFRKWTLEDLVEACSDALYEYEGNSRGVSLRTVQLDIQTMRSEKLGYSAPIVITDRKFYTYEDKSYSITNTPLTKQDLSTLAEVVEVLKQFKGFGHFEEMHGMVKRLEDKVYKQQNKGKSVIHFEKNDLLKGIELIDPLHKAILNKRTLEINYQSFKARVSSSIIFYPYLLKEHRNRWFVIGLKKGDGLLTLALDRIASVQELVQEKYVKNTLFDSELYYENTIGVTKSLTQRELLIVFKMDKQTAPYVITKPLHNSQKALQVEKEYTLFSINVVWNFELERELLGFGESLEVLSPRNLRKQMMKRIGLTLKNYEKKEINKTDNGVDVEK